LTKLNTISPGWLVIEDNTLAIAADMKGTANIDVAVIALPCDLMME
jgi:hypothetical protein